MNVPTCYAVRTVSRYRCLSWVSSKSSTARSQHGGTTSTRPSLARLQQLATHLAGRGGRTADRTPPTPSDKTPIGGKRLKSPLTSPPEPTQRVGAKSTRL